MTEDTNTEKREEQPAYTRPSPPASTGFPMGKVFAVVFVAALVGSLGGVLGGFAMGGFSAPVTGEIVKEDAPPPVAPPAPTPPPSANLADAIKNARHVVGNENAKLVIAEWSDFECPFCQRFFDQSVNQIKRDFVDTGKAKFVYFHFPLGFHKQAGPAAIASECAAEQEKFWPFHDGLFDNQGNLGRDLYVQLAEDVGVPNIAQFEECIDSEKYGNVVDADFAAGQVAGVSGTPTIFFVKPNGEATKVVGAQPYSAIKSTGDSVYASI